MKIQTEEIEKQAEQENINKLSKSRRSQPSGDTPINNDSRYTSNNRTCYRCGGQFPHTQKCAALGKTCYSCGKLDHFAEVCRSNKQPQPTNRLKMGRNQRQGDYTKPLNTIRDTDESTDEGDYKQEKHLFKIRHQTKGKINNEDFKVQVLIENPKLNC